MRTPLSLIIGPLDDMRGDDEFPKKYNNKLVTISKSAKKLLELINQILEFRKTETYNKRLCVAYGNVVDLVRETGVKYIELNTNRSLSLNINIEKEDITIYYDHDIISTILDNLLSNAMKYTIKGEITLTLRSIIVDKTKLIEFEVKDTGPGIPKESLSQIFDRYYQVDNKNQISGTGIGLALAQSLAILHQGSITVKSCINEGSIFSFRIKANNNYPDALHRNSEPLIEEQTKESENSKLDEQETTSTKKSILVVEDNDDIRNYIKESLSDYYIVNTASNGEEGLELAFLQSPDIILSDIMMPKMDGIELCTRLKTDIRTSHIPIILLTAKDTIEDKTVGYNVGADSYIVKPFNSALLHSRISNLFENKYKFVDIKPDSRQKGIALLESISELDKEFIDKVTDIIETNINSDQLDVPFVAGEVNMSHSTFYRKIKTLTDLTANEFIRKLRIQRAEELLIEGKHTISEIAFMVGFNTAKYFRQCFKDEYGLPPSEYIRELKSKIVKE